MPAWPAGTRVDSTTSSVPEPSAGRPVDVGPVAAFPDGSIRPVVVGRRSLVVVHHAGCWHALRDRCPHQGAPLSRGRIVEQACAHLEQGRPVFGAAVPALQCPWHGWSFLLADGMHATGGIHAKGGIHATGTSAATATARVRSYPVRVVAGRVTIEMQDGTDRHPRRATDRKGADR